MFKNLLSKVGWGELPSSFGFSVGDKVDVPFQWHWELHKGQKKSDGSPVSVFICGKKDLDSQQVAAAKNAVQMAKSLRHTHIIRSLDSIEVEGGFYLVTEQVMPLLCPEATEAEEREPCVWGLYQALDALGFLHQSGFTHGLFGPSAIFVTPQGDYRLGGFELCRKGADSAALLGQRRRCGPSVMSWPEPPACLQDGGAPTVGVDLWGAAVLMAFVFGSAKAQRRGVDFRPDMARASQDLPPELRKPFAGLAQPGPLKGRSPIADLLQLSFFQQNSSVRVMTFLGSLHIRSAEEKDGFFENLLGLLETVPISMQTRQVLPDLLEAQKFPGQEAAQVLPSILKIGIRLKDEDFKAKVAPLVAQLFASPDRAIRFRLLSSLGEMIDHLDDAMINDKIFPECVNGFTDSNGPIREATVKSLIYFVPRLKQKTVEDRIVKILNKLMSDPEASIRTNAVICCGRISSHLPQAVANQTLGNVLAAGFKDSFGPCRNAALQTLLACCSLFTAEELANRLMPGVCHKLVDSDPSVSDTAFNVLASLQQHIRQLVDERRAQAGAEPVSKDTQVGDSGGKDAGGWGSWAFSTVGSVVGNKIMGSMGPAKADSSGSVNSLASAGSGSGAAATPGGQAPKAPAAVGGNAPGRGMSLGSSSGAAAAAPGASTPFDGDDDDTSPGAAVAAGDGWGDDGWDGFGDIAGGGGTQDAPSAPAAKPFAPADRTAAPAVAKAKPMPKATPLQLSSKEDEDFWKEFDM